MVLNRGNPARCAPGARGGSATMNRVFRIAFVAVLLASGIAGGRHSPVHEHPRPSSCRPTRSQIVAWIEGQRRALRRHDLHHEQDRTLRPRESPGSVRLQTVARSPIRRRTSMTCGRTAGASRRFPVWAHRHGIKFPEGRVPDRDRERPVARHGQVLARGHCRRTAGRCSTTPIRRPAVARTPEIWDTGTCATPRVHPTRACSPTPRPRIIPHDPIS